MKKTSHNLFNVIIVLFIITVLISVIYHIAGIQQPKLMEHMRTSSAESQEEGASQYYNWGYKPINDPVKDEHHKKKMKKEHKDKCKQYFYNYYLEEDDHCRNCNILNNKDIDKYVLKSSVPPCPDMSKYVLKSEIPACPNLNEYIKKSEIKPCPDLRDYIKKSELRPEHNHHHDHHHKKCRTINEYNIEDHQDISNYIRKDKVNEYVNNMRKNKYVNKYNYNSNLTNVQNADYGNMGKYANLSFLDDTQNSKILNDKPNNFC